MADYGGEYLALPYFLAPMISWVVTQLIKFILKGFNNSWDWRNLYRSGSMPSSHAAVVLSLLVFISLNDGVYSVAFGIASVLSAIVLYDAVNVRHAVGEHGIILRQLLLKDAKKSGKKAESVRQSLGHTPLEVAVGGLIGGLISLALFVVQIAS